MKTKLAKNVNFLSPFIKGLGRIVPIDYVSNIRGYRVAKGLTEQQQASIVKHSSKRYVINLKVQSLKRDKKSYLYLTLEQVLLDLAHELAHLLTFDHDFLHFATQTKIMLHFSKVLRNNGYEDHSVRINRIRSLNEK